MASARRAHYAALLDHLVGARGATGEPKRASARLAPFRMMTTDLWLLQSTNYPPTIWDTVRSDNQIWGAR
jgi:hypothetical protein